MKKCNLCGTTTPDNNQKFCPNCGSEMVNFEPSISASKPKKGDENGAPMVGDKNLINNSTLIGKQDKYEASNITINNTITEDHSHTTVVCAVSGKRVYMDSSIVCPQCGKPVAPEYYVEATKRCENCEHKAEEMFRDFATQTLQGKSLNAGVKKQLESKGAELLLTLDKQDEILRSVQASSTVKESALSKMQQVELERAVERLVNAENENECHSACEVFELLHNTTQNYVADFWHYMASAVVAPQKYITDCENELLDNFWQRYWAFVAYRRVGSPKAASAIDAMRKSFAEHDADINLAETLYLVACGYDLHDASMLSRAVDTLPQINAEHLSKPLVPMYEIVSDVLQNGLNPHLAYSSEKRFVLVQILHADRFLAYVSKLEEQEKAAEQARLAEAERQRRAQEEQQRREAEAQRLREQQAREQEEKERVARQQRILSEQESKMKAEMKRLGVEPAEDSKSFVGYEATLPKGRKMGVGKILLFILLGLILLIGLLFLIPAPDSMQ